MNQRLIKSIALTVQLTTIMNLYCLSGIKFNWKLGNEGIN